MNLEKIEVSIVIPTWNRKEELKRCINHIELLEYKDYEIIVIDNNSTDGTSEMLKRKFPLVRIIENNTNLGAAYAKNQGVAISKGKYIWFLDSDSIVINNRCLTNMLDIMGRDKKIASIGGELVNRGNELKVKIHKIYRNGDGKPELFNLEDARLIDCKFLATSNCLVRKKLFKEVRGFDPYYFYIFEDIDLSLRLRERGYRNVTDSSTSVLHNPSKTSRISDFKRLHKNRIRFVIMNYSILFLIFLPLADIITSLLLIPHRVRESVRTDVDEIAYLQGKKYNKRKNLTKIFQYSILLCHSIIYGYIWNILNFSVTMNLKISKPNFLEEVHL